MLIDPEHIKDEVWRSAATKASPAYHVDIREVGGELPWHLSIQYVDTSVAVAHFALVKCAGRSRCLYDYLGKHTDSRTTDEEQESEKNQ